MRLVLHPMADAGKNVESGRRLELLQHRPPLSEIGRGGGVVLAPDAGEPAGKLLKTPRQRAGMGNVLASQERFRCVDALEVQGEIAEVAVIGGCGLLDSPEPGMSGTSSMKSAASASMLRTQCSQLPVPPWSSTSGSPRPNTRQTISPWPAGVARRVPARSISAMNSAGPCCGKFMRQKMS